MCADDQSNYLIMPNAKDQRKKLRERESKRGGGGEREFREICTNVKERKCKQDRGERDNDGERREETGRGVTNSYIKEPSDLTWLNTT